MRVKERVAIDVLMSIGTGNARSETTYGVSRYTAVIGWSRLAMAGPTRTAIQRRANAASTATGS